MKPASQRRLTSGLTKTRKTDGAVRVDLLGDDEEVLAGQIVRAHADLVRDQSLDGVGVLAGLDDAEALAVALDVEDGAHERGVRALPLDQVAVGEPVVGDGERAPFGQARLVRPSRRGLRPRSRSRARRSRRGRCSRRIGAGSGRRGRRTRRARSRRTAPGALACRARTRARSTRARKPRSCRRSARGWTIPRRAPAGRVPSRRRRRPARRRSGRGCGPRRAATPRAARFPSAGAAAARR